MRHNGRQEQRVTPLQQAAGSVPAAGYNRSPGAKPVSRPEIINYPNGRPQIIDQQKPKVFEPEKRHNERIPPVQVRTISPNPGKPAESSIRRNTGMNHIGVPERQNAQTSGPGKPIDSQLPASGGAATSWPVKKIDRPAFPQKDGGHRVNVPQRIDRQGGNPAQPQADVTPETREQSAAPPADGNSRKGWKVKDRENPATEAGTDGKTPGRVYVRPIRP
jgi:hypothetical protein